MRPCHVIAGGETPEDNTHSLCESKALHASDGVSRPARYSVCSREPAAHIELAQGCSTVCPSELLQRLEITIDTFERAEHIANALARVIVFVLIYVSPHTSSHSFSARNSIRPDVRRSARPIGAVSVASWREIKKLSRTGQGPPYPWPPPFLDPGSSPGTAGEIAHYPFISFLGAPDPIREIRDPEKLSRLSFAGRTSNAKAQMCQRELA